MTKSANVKMELFLYFQVSIQPKTRKLFLV